MILKMTVYKDTGKYYTHETIEVDTTKYHTWQIESHINEILEETIGENRYSDMFKVFEPIDADYFDPFLVKPYITKYNNGILRTYENNDWSLACHADIVIKDGIIVDENHRGMPRVSGDAWMDFYEKSKIGDKITDKVVEQLLAYNGKRNVVSVFHKR